MFSGLVGAILAFCVAYLSAWRLLPAVFAGPVDPYRADMLVVIEAGVRQFLSGHTPYTTYQVPWPATLPYGPTLWMPFTIPVAARTDLRILTLIGQLLPAAACLFAAVLSVGRRSLVPAIGLAGLGIFIAQQPNLASFHIIGHSPVYWPLIFVFLGLLRSDRWVAAATALGLLVSSRTTMLSLVPVFLIAAYHRKTLSSSMLLCLGVASIGPFVPFLFADAGSVAYAMYGSYLETVKRSVWVSHPSWVINTYGVTGPLVAHGLQSYAEAVQVSSVAIVYGCAWQALSRGARPEPWMGLALLVFSMTTLWPVIYLYFDVWVVLLTGLVWSSAPFDSQRVAAITGSVAVVCAIVLAAILLAAGLRPGAAYSIDVGTASAAALTGGGFGSDEAVTDGGRTYVWVTGGNARVRLPRAAWAGTDLRIALRPYESTFGRRQAVAAVLNGKPIGRVLLTPGWQDVTFHARASAWRYGFNLLDLFFSPAMPEEGSDEVTAKQLSVAVDRITIE